MPDRMSHTHPSIETYRGTLSRAGGTRRPVVRLQEQDAEIFPPDTTVRVEVNEQEYHAVLQRAMDTVEFNGLFDSPRFARNATEDRNYLPTWVKEHDSLTIGREILVDVIDPGFKYGYRVPGRNATYSTISRPNPALQDIAQQLDTCPSDPQRSSDRRRL